MPLFNILKKKKEADIPPPPPFNEPAQPERHLFSGRNVDIPPPPPFFGPKNLDREMYPPPISESQSKPEVNAPFIPKYPSPKIQERIQKQVRPLHYNKGNKEERPFISIPPEVRHPLMPEIRSEEEKPEKEINEIESKKKELEKKYNLQTPIFAKSDQYRTILGNIDLIRSKVKEAEHLSKRINEIKLTRDKESEKWRTILEDINEKIHKIDKVIAQ